MSGTQIIQTQVGEVKLLLPDFNSIPQVLREQPFSMWKAEPELDSNGDQKLKANGKPRIKKAPRNVAGFNISKLKPEEWLTYEAAAAAFDPDKYTGVGVLMQASSGLVGIDLDDVKDLVTVRPELKPTLRRAKQEGNYCEKSPSNAGLRLFVYGQLPNHDGRRSGGIELYSDKAFLTVTGRTFWPGEVKDGQWMIDELLGIIGLNVQPVPTNPTTHPVIFGDADHELASVLVDLAVYHHAQLWEGRWNQPINDLTDKSYPSQSEADMALVGWLAREACNRGCEQDRLAATMWAVFQQSGLYRHEKQKQVREYAIPKAIKHALESHSPTPPSTAIVTTATNSTVPVADTFGDVLNGRMFAGIWKDKFLYVASAGRWLAWREY